MPGTRGSRGVEMISDTFITYIAAKPNWENERFEFGEISDIDSKIRCVD